VPNPDKKGKHLANPDEQGRPGAVLVQGNLPRSMEGGVHTVDDVTLDAMGPGSERVRGFIDNTEVFRIMAEALGLGNVRAQRPSPPHGGPAAAK
jgi:alkaline phosphatase